MHGEEGEEEDQNVEEEEEEEEEDAEDDDEGYDSFVEERSQPDIPEPDPTMARVPDSDGWSLIARLGPLSSFLTCFPVLEEVPEQHHQAWVMALGEVLRRWRAATTEEETTLALSWFLFLAQGLLRRPRRGGRAGRKEVARRFTCITRGDWGAVVEMWERDKQAHTQERVRRSRRGRRGETEGEEAVRRRQVLALLSAGKISKAMTRVTSHGVASMDDPAVQAQVAAKYPARGRPLPARVPRGQPVDHLRGLRDELKGLEPGTSPGCGGMRPEFLRVVGEAMEEEDMVLLEEFGMAYLRGELPPLVLPRLADG